MSGVKVAHDMASNVATAMTKIQSQIFPAVEGKVAVGLRPLEACFERLAADTAASAKEAAENLLSLDARLVALESVPVRGCAMDGNKKSAAEPAVETPAEETLAEETPAVETSAENPAHHGKAETAAEAGYETETASGPGHGPPSVVSAPFEFHDLCLRLRRLRLNSRKATLAATEVLDMVATYDNFEKHPFAEMDYSQDLGEDDAAYATVGWADDCGSIGTLGLTAGDWHRQSAADAICTRCGAEIWPSAHPPCDCSPCASVKSESSEEPYDEAMTELFGPDYLAEEAAMKAQAARTKARPPA